MDQTVKRQLLSMKQLLRENILLKIRTDRLDDSLGIDAQFIIGEILRSVGSKVDAAGHDSAQAFMSAHGDTLLNLMNGLIGKKHGANEAALRQVLSVTLVQAARLLGNNRNTAERVAAEILDWLAMDIKKGGNPASGAPLNGPQKQQQAGYGGKPTDTSDSHAGKPARFYRGVRID